MIQVSLFMISHLHFQATQVQMPSLSAKCYTGIYGIALLLEQK